MYLRSVSGKIIFEGRFASIKQGVEMAVEKGANLEGINLRQANLSGALIDRAKMRGACFWGANLNGADMSDGLFEGSDFRAANLLNTCLAESNCHQTDFSGAYFSCTIFDGTDLSSARFSCPSIFSVNLVEAKTLQDAIYSHLGEVDCDLSHAPLIIRGLKRPMIFMDDSVLVGTDLEKTGLREALSQRIMDHVLQQKIL